MDELFEQFLREKKYLTKVTDGTISFYLQIYRNFKNIGAFENFSKASVNKVIPGCGSEVLPLTLSIPTCAS